MRLVGLIDTGLAPELVAGGASVIGFAAMPDADVVAKAGQADGNGHGSATSRLLAATIPARALVCAQIFDERGVTTPAAVGAALDALADRGAGLIVMALGLGHDRRILREACERAIGRGAVLVASAPARGGACFPAAYPGVISVCGDARCRPGEASWLGGTPAMFGASPQALPDEPVQFRGASMAAARFAAWLYPHMLPEIEVGDLLETLRGHCAYHGREIIRCAPEGGGA